MSRLLRIQKWRICWKNACDRESNTVHARRSPPKRDTAVVDRNLISRHFSSDTFLKYVSRTRLVNWYGKRSALRECNNHDTLSVIFVSVRKTFDRLWPFGNVACNDERALLHDSRRNARPRGHTSPFRRRRHVTDESQFVFGPVGLRYAKRIALRIPFGWPTRTLRVYMYARLKCILTTRSAHDSPRDSRIIIYNRRRFTKDVIGNTIQLPDNLKIVSRNNKIRRFVERKVDCGKCYTRNLNNGESIQRPGIYVLFRVISRHFRRV